MADLIIRPDAERDLREQWKYVARESSTDRANAFLNNTLNKLELLAERPSIARLRSDLQPDLRSYPVGQYIVFYLPLADGIEVVRVIHGRRDIASQFSDEAAEDS